MRCHLCDGKAVISNPARCRAHFIEDFERRVRGTIERFDLIRPGQRIAVACSGGKDSLTALSLLKRWYGDVTAIVVDEGIAGYRERTVEDLERVCAELGVPIVRTSYEGLTGKTLDSMLSAGKTHACTLCGTLRRHLIGIASRPFDVLATGHNADDEAQTVLMNLIRGNTEVFPRGGPKTGLGAAGFTQRVKPLFLCPEKEVMTYAYLHGFVSSFVECPNARDGYRWRIREALQAYEHEHPGTRSAILEAFLRAKEAFPARDVSLEVCSSCGEPSSRQVCKACEMISQIA